MTWTGYDDCMLLMGEPDDPGFICVACGLEMRIPYLTSRCGRDFCEECAIAHRLVRPRDEYFVRFEARLDYLILKGHELCPKLIQLRDQIPKAINLACEALKELERELIGNDDES